MLFRSSSADLLAIHYKEYLASGIVMLSNSLASFVSCGCSGGSSSNLIVSVRLWYVTYVIRDHCSAPPVDLYQIKSEMLVMI